MSFSKEDTKVIKGAAIFLMLYHHLFRFPDRIAEGISYVACFNIAGNTSAYWLAEFGKLCVALFFFLGGYGTFLSFRDSTDQTAALWKKIKGLYTEYWKVFVIFIPLCMLLGVARVEKHLASLVWNFSGMETFYNGEWWFFTPYLLMMVSYPVIHWIVNRKSSVFTDLLGVFLLNVIVNFVIPNIYTYGWAASLQRSFFWKKLSVMLTYSPMFVIGCVFAKHDLLSKAKQRFSGHVPGFLLSGAILLLLFYMRKHSPMLYDIFYAPVFSAALIIFLSSKPCKPLYFILKKVGQESTLIWLTHSFFCYHLCQRFIFLPRYTPLIFLLLLVVSYVTAVALRYFYSLLYKGYCFAQKKLQKHCRS